MSEQTHRDYIHEIVVFQQTWFSAQSSGLYRFAGGRWHNALTSLGAEPFAVTTVMLPPGEEIVFAGATGVILRSRDGAASWEVMALPGPPPVITALVAAGDYARSGTLYAATLEDGVFVSPDRGARWDAWNFGLLGFSVSALLAGENGMVYAGNDLGIYLSRNSGRSWHEVALLDAPVTALAFADGGLWIGTEGLGLWRLRGDHREPVAPDVVTGTVERVIADSANLLILCDSELLLSRDSGQTWRIAATGPAVTAIAAPEGLVPGAAVVVGREGGQIQAVTLV